MSFNFNPNINLSNVQASAKSCPGGGGNTGYFERNSKDESEESDFTFSKNSENDSFEKINEISEESDDKDIIELLKEYFMEIFQKIKNFFKIN